MNIEDLPLGPYPQALEFSHFPTRWQAVLWRNWELVPVEKIAEILEAPVLEIVESAKAMGLCAPCKTCNEWLERGYITIIRNNWHLLPYEQLLRLLEWTPGKLDFILREDDFLWHKLGKLKPKVEAAKWAPLNEDEQAATSRISKIVDKYFANSKEIEKPFEFFKKYSETALPKQSGKSDSFDLKFIYSYHALCGDALLEPELEPYPDELLKAYSNLGINGVWLQGILYSLFPLDKAPEFSEGYKIRLVNLKRLVDKAAKYGIKIYLYLNEPRGMPERFFNQYPGWKGVFHQESNNYSLCTSNPEVLQYLEDATSFVFAKAPGLGGAFCVTMSENTTNCHARWKGDECPQCAKRPVPDVIAETISAIEKGVHKSDSSAKVMAHTWAWGDFEKESIGKLPQKVEVLRVSEWGKKFNIGGIDGSVVDYSMSVVGPSEESKAVWKKARECKLKTIAKVQLNNTWECSAVPYIPTPQLVKEHIDNLASEGVDSLMLSWTLGGYPSWNLELLRKSPEELALEKFGAKVASGICEAWEAFSEAFREFPFHVGVLYCGPQNYGPANLFYSSPTGYEGTMIGFPYDDIDSWRAIYPEHIFEKQFEKLCEKWKKGLELLKGSQVEIPNEFLPNYTDMRDVATAMFCHLKSSLNLLRFTALRDSDAREELMKLLDDEIETTLCLHDIVLRDSRIGFEASNHYYYTKNNLKEKILNCEYLKGILQ